MDADVVVPVSQWIDQEHERGLQSLALVEVHHAHGHLGRRANGHAVVRVVLLHESCEGVQEVSDCEAAVRRTQQFDRLEQTAGVGIAFFGCAGVGDQPQVGGDPLNRCGRGHPPQPARIRPQPLKGVPQDCRIVIGQLCGISE